MSTKKAPKLSTPLLDQSGLDLPLDLPASDHVVSLRWIGKAFELHLSPKLGVFQIGARLIVMLGGAWVPSFLFPAWLP